MSGNSGLPVRGGQQRVPGNAGLPRVRLRVVGGDLDEAVLRRRRFESAHPEIVITAPGAQACLWSACRDDMRLASGYQLSALLDTLGRLLGEQQ